MFAHSLRFRRRRRDQFTLKLDAPRRRRQAGDDEVGYRVCWLSVCIVQSHSWCLRSSLLCFSPPFFAAVTDVSYNPKSQPRLTSHCGVFGKRNEMTSSPTHRPSLLLVGGACQPCETVMVNSLGCEKHNRAQGARERKPRMYMYVCILIDRSREPSVATLHLLLFVSNHSEASSLSVAFICPSTLR